MKLLSHLPLPMVMTGHIHFSQLLIGQLFTWVHPHDCGAGVICARIKDTNDKNAMLWTPLSGTSAGTLYNVPPTEDEVIPL